MSPYTPAILRMGIVLPGAMNVVILSGVLWGYLWFTKEKAAREKRYKEHMERLAKCDVIEGEVKPLRPRFKDEVTCLTKDLRQELTSNFSKATVQYKEFELQQSSVSFPQGRGPLDGETDTPKSRIETEYKGGFGPMEETLFRVENRLPQLTMEKMSINRVTDIVTSDGAHLVFSMDLMGWSLNPSK